MPVTQLIYLPKDLIKVAYTLRAYAKRQESVPVSWREWWPHVQRVQEFLPKDFFKGRKISTKAQYYALLAAYAAEKESN